MRSARGSAGAATVVTTAFAGLLLLVGLALAGVEVLVVDHRRAQSAADLAALAAAADPARACGTAAAIAAANGAAVVACARDGLDVVVRVSVPSRPWAGWGVDLTADARAGPA